MKFELLVLNLKIYLCKILKRDSMKYKLRKYELSGVKIGGGYSCLFTYNKC